MLDGGLTNREPLSRWCRWGVKANTRRTGYR